MAKQKQEFGFIIIDPNQDMGHIMGYYKSFEDAQANTAPGYEIHKVVKVWKVVQFTRVKEQPLADLFEEEE